MDNKLPVVGKLYKIVKTTAFHNKENTYHPFYYNGIVFLTKINKLTSSEVECYYILFNGKVLYHTMHDLDKNFWFHFAEIK